MVYIVSRTNHFKLCLLNHNLRFEQHSKISISVARRRFRFVDSTLSHSICLRINIMRYNFINEIERYTIINVHMARD